MSFTPGFNGYFAFDNSSDVLTDFSDKVSSGTMQAIAELLESTTLGKTSRTRVGGLKDGSIQAEGYWDATIDAALWAARGTLKTFEFAPPGSSSGNVYYTGEFLCESYQIGVEVDGLDGWQAS